jgi:hypothetical protein
MMKWLSKNGRTGSGIEGRRRPLANVRAMKL